MFKERTAPAEPGDLIQEPIEFEEIREWTLMFYFASDNALAPSIVSQLKALKVAGFHADANVIAHFDPYIKGVPSHVFEVNVVEKLKRPRGASLIGFDTDEPDVRKLVLDKVWESGDEENAPGAKVRQLVKAALRSHKNAAPDDRKLPVLPKGIFEGERPPKESLATFLEFCRRKYPAKRYMLFILGHGVVVGNDVFLFDSNPGDDSDPDEDDARTTRTVRTAGSNGHNAPGTPADQQGNGNKSRRRNSLTLRQLGKLLSQFKTDIGGSKFDLLSLHSCSMSGIEVAYQLQDTAHYMLASQGPAFVGSWPYRQILHRIFDGLGTGGAPRSPSDGDVRATVIDIFDSVVHNSYDFHMAGYSFDVALCDLTQVGSLKNSIDYLASTLRVGLAGEADLADDSAAVPLARELILLAHWDAQSFWQENYTDLYDFCLRLGRRCAFARKALAAPSAELDAIIAACEQVKGVLEKGTAWDDKDRLVVRSGFVGAQYQYAHGLSIYFPWAKPADRFFDRTYGKYEFAMKTGWAGFLGDYFVKTRRATRKEEDEMSGRLPLNALIPPRHMGTDDIERKALELMQGLDNRTFSAVGELAKNGNDDRTGDCDCPVFKNHPSFTGDEHRQPISRPIGETVNSTSAA